MSLFIFSKMHGAGNDFVVLDDFNQKNNNTACFRTPEFITRICNRRRGIGADGFIIISSSIHADSSIPCFKMDYFNCDGASADMCGNGLRCAALYASNHLTDKSDFILFETGAGLLETRIRENGKVQIQIPLIKPPEKLKIDNQECFTANTGVPHLIVPRKDFSTVDIVREGGYFRNLELFHPEGTNVNFIPLPSKISGPVYIRTFERGVENETSACGTGIAAAAVSLNLFYDIPSPINFITKDNDIITIDFYYNDNTVRCIKGILLTGPTEEVYRGSFDFDIF